MKDYRGFDENDIDDYIKTAYTYNSAGLVTQITYSDKTFIGDDNPSGITEQYTVQYDGRGYIVGEIAETHYGAEAQTVNKAYVYDPIGRLTQATTDENTTQYTYDRVGNRLTMDNGDDVLGYTYNQFDQLQEVSKNNETQTTYEYDLRGNQTKESSKYFDLTVGGVTTTYYNTTDYSYNMRNQMIGTQINTPQADTQTGEVTYETLTASNVYNAQGQRVQKTGGTDTTKYFYSGTALFYTTNGWGTLTTENILDLGGQIAASKRFQDPNEPETNPFANKYYFYNYDIRGSVTNIVGPDGKLVTGYGYDEFGNQSRSGDGSFLNEVTFTGSVSDASTGLQYMNARFYQPTTGRFLSQDSYTGNAYDPWTQHLYSYCMNNPTNYIDPTGHTAYIAVAYMMKALEGIRSAGGSANHLVPAINYANKIIGKGAPLVELVPEPKKPQQKTTSQKPKGPAEPTQEPRNPNAGYSLVYYGQGRKLNDKKESWHGTPYGPKGCSTYAYAACTPTAVAMVLSSYTGTSITPVDVGTWMTKNGYRTETSVGTIRAGVGAAIKHWGFNYTYYDEVGTDALSMVRNGYMAVTHWSTGFGHYLVIADYDPDIDKYLVWNPAKNDPKKGRKYTKEQWYTANELTDIAGLDMCWVVY